MGTSLGDKVAEDRRQAGEDMEEDSLIEELVVEERLADMQVELGWDS